jgi:hypothetical protein
MALSRRCRSSCCRPRRCASCSTVEGNEIE